VRTRLSGTVAPPGGGWTKTVWIGLLAMLSPSRPVAQDSAPEEPAKQVRVQVRVLEWQLNDLMDFDFAVLFNQDGGSVFRGGDLTLPSTMPLSSAARLFLDGLDAGSGAFEAVIETLQSYAKVEILSQPEVVVRVGGESGRVSNTTDVPFETVTAFGTNLAVTTNYAPTGVDLECKVPSVKYDDLIHLDLKVTVTDQVGSLIIGTDKNNNPMPIPIRDTREMNSQIIVADGSVLIAGLLKTSRELERGRGIPILSEIPPFRWFLKSKTRRFTWDNEYTELVFLVKAEILDSTAGRR